VQELSMHILDLVQNSLAAGASFVEIRIEEEASQNLMIIEIQDNGHGIPQEMQPRVTDPFTTSRNTRPVGLGLSLCKAAAERCVGKLQVESEWGRGTKIRVTFQHDHFDRAPLGDMGETLAVLITANPKTDFSYRHRVGNQRYSFDTREMRAILGDVALDGCAVVEFVKEDVRKGLKNIGVEAFPKAMEVLK